VDAADFGVPEHRWPVFIALKKSKHPIEFEVPKREMVTTGSTTDFNSGRWSQIDHPRRSAAALARVNAPPTTAMAWG